VEDKTIECADCQQAFTWNVGEQEFYQRSGFVEPRRCKPCRELRKAKKNGQGPKPTGRQP
jgi:hypothetical protein